MVNLYKNYVTNEYTVKKWIENELKKRVRFDNIITETINFNKIFGGSATLGGTNNGNGELIIKDSSDVEKVKINNLGITLADDTEIIGGDGVLSTFQYNGINDYWFTPHVSSYTNGYWFLGYNSDMFSENWGNYIFFDVNIPSNFTISSATITIFHSPVYWDNGGDYALWGYCRNVKAYTITNYNSITVNAAYASDYEMNLGYTFSEIANAFGASGFTANVPTTPSHDGQIVTSANIGSSLAVGFNKIAIKTGDAVPAFNASVATNGANLGAKTGMVFAVLNVTGYQGKE